MIGPAKIMILALALVGTALPLAAQSTPEPIVKVEGSADLRPCPHHPG